MLREQNKKLRILSLTELFVAKSEENDQLWKRKYEIHNWGAWRDKSVER